MEYRIEPLDEQSWRIEEYDTANSAYFYLLAGAERALLLDTGFGTLDVRALVEELAIRCTVNQLEPCHMEDVIEDALAF